MMSKRFLVPVLALVGFGLPAGAAVVTYCAGTGCGAFDETAFNNDLTADTYTLGALTTFSLRSLSGATYTDSSGVLFADYLGNPFALSGSELMTPTTSATPNYIVITIPSTIAAIQFNIDVPGGVCLDAFCPANELAGFVGFINPNPLAQWSVEFGPTSTGGYVGINSFNVAMAGPGNPDTPEVGTLLLIGSGLIAMRWMRRVPLRVFRTLRPA
jgi:hypothetical protein